MNGRPGSLTEPELGDGKQGAAKTCKREAFVLFLESPRPFFFDASLVKPVPGYKYSDREHRPDARGDEH